MKCLINFLHSEFFNLLIKGHWGINLSIGETECIFSPQNGRMLEASDCYVIADTLRFFSENNGALRLFWTHSFQLKTRLSAKTDVLGISDSMAGTVSNCVGSSITYSIKELSYYYSDPIMLPWLIPLASRYL